MSQIKISQLPYVGNTGYTATDIIPFVSYIVPTGTTSETKIDDLKNYVLENSFFLPLSGGTVTGDTIFTSGLTATTISATTYQNLPIDPDTYVTGYTYNDNVFTINQNNGQPDLTATIDSVTGMTVNGNLTVTGNTSVQGLTATTISATTYQNLPIDPDTYVTGFTYSANTFTISDNSGSTFNSTFNDVTGLTVNGDLTVTGNTSLQGLSATTISATTYQNLPIDPDTYVTGFTYGSNVFTIKQNNGQPDLTALINSVTGMTVNGNLTVTGNTSVQGLTATTISATTYQNLPIDPDTYTTGYTYSDNTFTIKQNNGQPDLTALINSVTGMTVNGDLTVTGNTSAQGITATTFSSSTVNVGNTTGTPSQAASFDVNGKLVAGLGQTTYATYGDSSLTAPTLNSYTLIPNLTQTISVPSNCSVFITTTGGVGTSNNNSNTATVDIAILIDGALLPSGGFSRINSVNPNAINNAFTNETWAVSTIQTLSAGNHTIDVRVNPRSITGGNIVVSGAINNVRQGELYITIIKN